MIPISIDVALQAAAQNAALGLLSADVNVTAHEPSLWEEIDQEIGKVSAALSLDRLQEEPDIKALRDAYRTLGKDPSRYRGSQEALLRRVLQGKGLYRVNTIVDINNLISLRTRRSVGSYNLGALRPPILFRKGAEGESYKGIGKEAINVSSLPLFADQAGPFGSPTSDSERAKITPDTKQLLMVIIAFTGAQFLFDQLQQTAQLLRAYAQAHSIETAIVE